MDVLSLKGKLPFEILESIAGRGISEFTPPQEEAIRNGLLGFENMVVAAPTASGKTLIAELACANSILTRRSKAVYIAPMRALVSEKYEEFKQAYPYLKTGMSIGDLDSSDEWLSSCNMIFVSTEKFDSLLRHGINWLQNVGCIVFDEIHMLGDTSRGPTLELLITKLINTCNAQIIALSATIGNSDEIAKWLNAKLIKSEFRPVALKKGIVYGGEAYYYDTGGKTEVKKELEGTNKLPELLLVQDTLSQSKQILMFYSTKRNAEAGAIKAGAVVKGMLKREEQMKLEDLSGKVLGILERPTEQCVKLSNLVKEGVAFHHAGLLNAQRRLIEEAFKNNLIKAICSTTTLGLGVNLPAHTVLVRDTNRFDGGSSEMMGVNEVAQLFGRAGRPKYDKEGRAMLIANTKEKIEELYKNYILARPEAIDSNLGVLPVLRTHVLAFIAENFLNGKGKILQFLGKTFYGHQYGNEGHMRRIIEQILNELVEFEFITQEDNDYYRATKLGKRVSELYIDPLSAKWIIESLSKAQDDVGLLYVISNTLEMRPYAKATEEAEAMFILYRYLYRDSKLLEEYDRMDYGFYDPVRAFSTALMLRKWIEEVRETEIIKEFRSTPGELYTKITNADWMIYSAIELSKIAKNPVHRLIDLRVRLRYGIKEELLDLVRLEQIGRVRARALYVNGIRKVSDIRNNREAVTKLLGKEIANKVFAQLG